MTSARPGGRDRHRRHRLDARRHRAGADDDPRAGPLLRRARAGEEPAQHVHDVRRRDRDRDGDLGGGRLLARLRRNGRSGRRPQLRLPERRHPRAAQRDRDRRSADDPAPPLLRLPGDLLHHHGRADLRRRGRADALQRLPRLRGACGRCSSTRCWPTGPSAAAGCSSGAPSTSPVASRSRWPRASRPWPPRWWSARARTTGARPCSPTTPSTCWSAPGCCGSAGSASTAAAASAPTPPARSPSSTRC